MGFIENLRKKIAIKHLAAKVVRSWGSADNPQRMNRDAMEQLLAMSDLIHRRERDLDLYYRDAPVGKPMVLVLDNELKLYHTDIEDVAMRKSPTVKEMVSIRKAIKILNDKDVTVSRKQDSVQWLTRELIDDLDLSYSRADIKQMAEEGRLALADNNSDGVIDMLTLFADLLGYVPAPEVFAVEHCRIWGAMNGPPAGEPQRDPAFGPTVIFNQSNNHLALINTVADSRDPDDIRRMALTAQAKTPADSQGEEVWAALVDKVTTRPDL